MKGVLASYSFLFVLYPVVKSIVLGEPLYPPAVPVILVIPSAEDAAIEREACVPNYT